MILLTLLCGASICHAQQSGFKTTGNVKDINGNPIVGAAIRQVGTFIGTIANLDGNYELYVSQQNCFLSCSCVGYKTKIQIRIGQVNNFILEEDNASPDSISHMDQEDYPNMISSNEIHFLIQ